MTSLTPARLRTASPLWWRLPMWSLITAATVLSVHPDPARRWLAGVLAGGGALALQAVRARALAAQRAAIVVTSVLGLAGCIAAPAGFAYLLVVIAAARAPQSLEGRALQVFTVLDSIAFGVAVAVAADSVPGLLAGLGIPALVQRSVEHRELARERDRATALLDEARRGRESETRAAALQERARIAGEMHDVLAHSLAGLSVQLQAVRAVAAREHVGPAVLEPLDTAAALARDGLAEARAAVGALREPDGAGGLQLSALPALVARHPGEVGYTVDGPAGRLGPDAEHAVYRAVQESLTNAARYAPGSPVRVALRWHPDRLVVSVTDSGPAAGRTPLRGVGSGLGLAGMAERVAAAGGTVQAGPAGPNGAADGPGWCVHLELPTVPASAEAAR